MTTTAPELTPALARHWLDRWDDQQRGHLPDREERFTALIDAVEAATGRPDPLVLDLGAGPGSLAVRLLDRLPGATVIAIDTHPLLLALGRTAHADRPGLRWAHLDLTAPGWAARLGLDRQADAAVSTTALHWIDGEQLRTTYRELATLMRPGAVFLNGDNLAVDDTAPTLARLDRALQDRETGRAFAHDRPEDWDAWWDAVRDEPALAALHQDSAAHEHGSESRLLSTHVRALDEAGFSETGTLWQRGDNRLLAAVLG